MTRINVVPPEMLTDQHIRAEYRELPRAFPLAAAALRRGVVLGPPRYTMGEGHVTFFYSRTDYLADRHAAIVAELLKRGYNLEHREPLTRVVGYGVSRWQPTERDISVNLERLCERLRSQPGFYKYYRQPVSADFYGD